MKKLLVSIFVLFLVGCGPRMECSEWGYVKVIDIDTGIIRAHPVCLAYNIDGKPARLVQ